MGGLPWGNPLKLALNKSRIYAKNLSKIFYMKPANTVIANTATLKQASDGAPVPSLCREHGMNSVTFDI
jgi:hypothetical protein